MKRLFRLSTGIDALNARLGMALAWLVLVVALISTANAVVRKLFDTSSNAWLELQWVIFGIVFLCCAPWTLLSNDHIRIDIVSNLLPRKARNIIELIGHVLFLLPLTLIMIITSYPFFVRSYELKEQSMNAGGLAQWPAKSLILISFVLLFLQGLSELIKRIGIMRGLLADPYADGASHSAIESEAERVLAQLQTDRR